MTDKQLKRLSKTAMLTIMRDQEAEIEQLKSEISQLRQQVEERKICLEECGSIAEAALKLNSVFETAQAAANLYLENIQKRAEG